MAELSSRKFIVFSIEHYGQLGVIRTLGKRGLSPDVIAVKNTKGIPVGSISKYANKVYEVSSVEDGYSILMKEYKDSSNKPILITCCDQVLSYLDQRYEEVSEYFITFNAGKPNGINEYMNKTKLQDLAREVGLPTIPTYSVDTGIIPEDIEYPVITKAENPTIGGWKSDVYICNNRDELSYACSHIKSPRILIQKYISKINELSYSGFSFNRGEQTIFCMMNNELYTIDGYYNPYHTVENPDKPELESLIAEVLRRIGFEGIFSVEFLEDEDHNYYFTEINFRQSAWDWSCDIAGNPLTTMWAQCMIDGSWMNVSYTPIKEGFTGLVEPIDYGKRVLTGKINIWEWMKDIMTADALYYYDPDDIEPFNLLISYPDRLL